MKTAWIEFRLFVAERLLGLVLDIVPKDKNCKDGQRITFFILHYFKHKLGHENNSEKI